MPKIDTQKLGVLIQAKMKAKKLADLPALFQVLGDLTRLRLLQTLLTNGKRSVSELCEELGLAQPLVSHHLGLLRRNGLVVNVRAGKNIIYSIAK